MRVRLVVLGLVLSACGGSGVIEVTDAWAGTTPPGVDAAAIYLTITNGTGSDDRVVGFGSERCAAAELHASVLGDDQVMRMRPATPEALTVPAGGELVMQPGSLHVMCVRPTGEFVEGDNLAFSLTLESGLVLAGTATVENR